MNQPNRKVGGNKPASNPSELTKGAMSRIDKTSPDWLVRYRPQTIDDVILPQSIMDTLRSLRDAQNLPHLLMYGPAGVGKTSAALALTSDVGRDPHVHRCYLQPGVDGVRAGEGLRGVLHNGPVIGRPQVAILEEADALSKDAQLAMRGDFLEDTIAPVVLLCNDPNKLVRPLRNRLVEIDFSPVADIEECFERHIDRLCWILQLHQIEHKRDEVIGLVKPVLPSMRQAIMKIQLITPHRKLFSGPSKDEKTGRNASGEMQQADSEAPTQPAAAEAGKGQRTDVEAFEQQIEALPGSVSSSGAQPIDDSLSRYLQDVAAQVERFLVLDRGDAGVIAVFTFLTYVHDALQNSPILSFLSPELGSGKSSALSVVARLVGNPRASSNLTTAALYRAAADPETVLLIDEADTFMAKHEDMRGILNSGFSRDFAYVERVGPQGKNIRYPTWCPKVIARIGKLHETLASRSIIIPLKRQRADEKRDRLLSKDVPLFARLRQRAASLAREVLKAVEEADPEIPSEIFGRTADCWRPLLAIAELAGGRWPDDLRRIAVDKSADLDVSIGTMTLSEIRSQFLSANAERLFTREILDHLSDIETGPWASIFVGTPQLRGRRLASILKPYGIAPKPFRKGENGWGYERADFEDSWARYLPEIIDKAA